ncbi:uncharacterized protein LOC144349947 [Saccoglossus kowalevskii]
MNSITLVPNVITIRVSKRDIYIEMVTTVCINHTFGCSLDGVFVTKRFPQFVLRNHVISSQHTGTLGRCGTVCQATLSCVSFNFNHVTGWCDLNNARMDDYLSDKQVDFDSRYVQIVVTQHEFVEEVCDPTMCQNNGVCVLSGCDTNSLVCDCQHGYGGELCEHVFCTNPATPDFGGYDVSADGNKLSFWCDADYVVYGSGTLWCVDGNWSDGVPSCRRKDETPTALLLPSTGQFLPFQDLDLFSTSKMASIAINGTYYLAVLSLQYGCVVYQFVEGSFSFFQLIQVNELVDVELVNINARYYLFLAISREQNQDYSYEYVTNSKVYVWEDNEFVFHLDVPTVGAYDWHYFTHGGQHYLVLASYQDADDNFETTKSTFYVWNETQDALVTLQNIPTVGCRSVTSLTQSGDAYVVFASEKGNSNAVNLYPTSYKLSPDGLSLTLAQTIGTSRTTYYLTMFEYYGKVLLASTTKSATKPMMYSSTGTILEEYGEHSDAVHAGMVCPFQHGGRQYLVYPKWDSNSILMRDNADDWFEVYQTFQFNDKSQGCHVMDIEGAVYMMYAILDTETPVRIYIWT